MTTPRVTVPPQALEAIAFNLCSLHDFDQAFVQQNERFAMAAITEYLRATPAPAAPQAAGVGALVGQIDALLAIPDENLSTRVPHLARELLERAASHLRAPSREPEGGVVEWRVGDRVSLHSGGRGTIVNVRYGVAMDLEDGSPDLGWAPQNFLDTDPEDFILATREEAPAEAGESDKRAWIDRWNAIEDAARDALHTMNELLAAPNLKRMQYALGERRDVLSAALNLPEAGTAWMRSTAIRAQPQAREDARPVAWEYRHKGQGWVPCSKVAAADFARFPQDYDVRPLYTHPAPDALRVAVEALTAAMRVMTRIAATSSANLDQAITNIAEMREAALHGADAAAQALAALQAEQGAQ